MKFKFISLKFNRHIVTMHIAKKTITFNQKETPGIDQTPGSNIEEGKTDYSSHRKEVGALAGLTPTQYDSGGRLPTSDHL